MVKKLIVKKKGAVNRAKAKAGQRLGQGWAMSGQRLGKGLSKAGPKLGQGWAKAWPRLGKGLAKPRLGQSKYFVKVHLDVLIRS